MFSHTALVDRSKILREDICIFFIRRQSSGTEGQIGSMQRLDLNFAINEYMSETGITFKLRKTRTKNAELLLQQMFEDELDEKDLGPELMDDDEELNEVVENNELLPLPRKLTLQTIDLVW